MLSLVVLDDVLFCATTLDRSTMVVVLPCGGDDLESLSLLLFDAEVMMMIYCILYKQKTGLYYLFCC